MFPIRGKHGPAKLAESYTNTIISLNKNKNINKYFDLIIKSYITFTYFKFLARNSCSIVWFMFSDYFSQIMKYKNMFKNTIYGPMVSPKKWLEFPLENTYETNWTSYIRWIFSYVVQSERVKNHLINNSEKINDIKNKYLVSHGCLFSNSTNYILAWKLRKYDILIYVKFADLDRQNDLNHLVSFLTKYYKIKIVKYGNHTKESLSYAANNSKILIYYSYYDCWPASLMEMQNMGVFPIVEECEFIEEYGICIKNINTNLYKLNIIIRNILFQKHDSSKISSFYIKRNDCLNIFKKTLNEIYFRKTNIRID